MIDPIDYQVKERDNCVRIAFGDEGEPGVTLEIDDEIRSNFAEYMEEKYLPSMPLPLEIKEELRKICRVIDKP